jgi:cell division protease FtsH
MPRKKNNVKFALQMRVIAVWLILIFAIFSLWNLYNPEVTSHARATWSISKVLEASERGFIISGVVQSVPASGPEWYKLAGEVKLDKPIKLSDGKIQDSIHFEASGRLTSERYGRLLNSSTVWKEKPSSTLWTEILVSVLPFLIIFTVLYFFVGRQLRGAGKTAMNFAKSRAKLLTQDKKKVTFSDVAGCDEAKEEVAEIVDFLKNPKKFNEIGGRIPKGCLMFGPPGTGKTLLAKAVAGEADVPFFSISGSDFVEMFVGVGASRVRDLFEQGRKNAPCILFIDEIDAVGRQRGAGLGGGNDEREQTLNSLLVEMDGFDGREGVIIIAATNRPDVLDSALLRPGRFDRQVVIDLPDLHGREEILRVHAKKIKLDETVDLADVARSTSGFSGADLENLLNESALAAARENKKMVSRFDIDEARDKISYGRERKKLMDDADKEITAYHEAGHAIVQVVVDDGNLPVHKVTILPRGQSLGMTMMKPTKDILNRSKKNLLAEICCSMGGRVAEELVFGEITTGASCDIKQATKTARKMVCDWGMSPLGPVAYGENHDHIFLGREISRSQNYSEQTALKIDSEILSIVDVEYKRAQIILLEKRSLLDKLSDALLQYETIEGESVYELVKHGDFVTPLETRQKGPPPGEFGEKPKKNRRKKSDDGGDGGKLAAEQGESSAVNG